MIWDKLTERGILDNADSRYLYRGINEKEIDAGVKLIAEGMQTFEGPKLVIAKPSGVYGFENAGPGIPVSNHINERPTSGVSTSTEKEVAIAYALRRPLGKQYVVTINREKAKALGIKEIVVKEALPLWAIPKPYDEEVILTSSIGFFPDEVIEKYEKLNENN
jgi:hypothetical protein